MKNNRLLNHAVFPLLGLITLFPFIDPALALIIGVGCACLLQNPYQKYTQNMPKHLLAVCVIGLGGGMDLRAVLHAGLQGFGYTALSIALTLALAWGLAHLLKAEKECATLIAVGTAICGGSAIAAVAPVINARSAAIAVSLAVVFVLNALALVIFPAIGHMLDMGQHDFGLWSALAIHDTSSVVGAGLKYGDQALETGASVKLARALWIVPLVLIVQAVYNKTAPNALDRAKPKYPWFILGFLAFAGAVTFVPELTATGHFVSEAARRGLVLTLFLIGTNLNLGAIRSVGLKPYLYGGILWVVVSVASLLAILSGIIG